MDEGMYVCRHCNGLIESLNEACNHECFRGKEHIYQNETDSSVLYVDNNEDKENDEEQVLNNEDFEIHNFSSSGCNTANVESQEGLSYSEDFIEQNNANKNAVWAKKATMAMLSLYEGKIHMLNNIGKQSQVWKRISEDLKDLCIQVTADQIKWKFNRLNSKYKQCIDNNSKSGRAHMTFEYYEQFEQIFHKEKNISAPRTLSSSIFATCDKKRKQNEVTESNIIKDKKLKVHATSSGKSAPPVDESSKYERSPVACEKKNSKNHQRFQNLEVLQQMQENQKCRDEKMSKYLKIKEKEMELKKKAVDVREIETQVNPYSNASLWRS